MENNNLMKVIILMLAGVTIWNTIRIESVIEKQGSDDLAISDTVSVAQTDSGEPLQIAELQRQISNFQKKVKSLETPISKRIISYIYHLRHSSGCDCTCDTLVRHEGYQGERCHQFIISADKETTDGRCAFISVHLNREHNIFKKKYAML